MNFLSAMALDEGNFEQATMHFEQAGPGFRLTGIAMTEHTRGNADAAQRALEALVAQYAAGFAYQIAQVHALREEREQALDWLETSLTQRNLGSPRIRWDPLFASLHAEPRFQARLDAAD